MDLLEKVAALAGRVLVLERQASGQGRIHTGDIVGTIALNLPVGWLWLDGTTIVGGQTLYPDLWAVIPAAWKSGADIILGDSTNKVLRAGGTLGGTSGATSVTIAEANLPSHTHTGPSHTHTITHTHTINHNHPAKTSTSDGAHSHTITNGVWLNRATTSGSASILVSAGGTQTATYGPTAQGAHTHSVNPTNYTGNSGGSSAANTGSSGTGATGATGSGSTLNVAPYALRILFRIKT